MRNEINNQLNDIYEQEIVSELIHDRKSIHKCMVKSYELGTEDVLKWLSNMDYLSDNITYIIEEWKNLNNKNI
jgi:hypothetical protein